MNKGDYAKGEAELEILLQRNPDDPGPNNDLGYLYAEQGKNLEKAEIDDPQGPARGTRELLRISIAWAGSCSSGASSRRLWSR